MIHHPSRHVLQTLAAAVLLATSAGTAAVASPPAATLTPAADMPAGAYKVDPNHAFVLWKVKHTELSTYVARFTKFDATIDFNPKDVTKSTVTAKIDPTSIETDYVPGERDFNKELAQDETWFNAGKFPDITFKSTKVEKTGDNTGVVTGDLTLLGVTKPVTLDVTYNGAYADQPFSHKPTLGFAAVGVIKRSDWGLATYVPMIGDEVTLEIHGEFAQE
jgi:polyisoprenoid-binding protein YceI